MDQNNNFNSPQPHPQPQPVRYGRGLLIGHIVNLVLIIIIFFGTHYVLSSNQCTPEVSFRWSVIAAAIYALLSTMLVSMLVHRKKK